MALDITKPGIDLGIVTSNGEAMNAFYGETLGLPHVGDFKMGGGSVMQRYQCGDSVVKVVVLPGDAPASAAPGGINGATGYRYFTITVSDITGSIAPARPPARPSPFPSPSAPPRHHHCHGRGPRRQLGRAPRRLSVRGLVLRPGWQRVPVLASIHR